MSFASPDPIPTNHGESSLNLWLNSTTKPSFPYHTADAIASSA
jgi:hypothetical protein